MNVVCVPIDTEIVAEFVLRKGEKSVDLTSWIKEILADYLERTAMDEGWDERYYELKDAEWDRETEIRKLGDANRGYQWKEVFLRNGTAIRMTYKGQNYYARVEHEQVVADGTKYSPSSFVMRVTENVPRNAWRAIWVRRPDDNTWRIADDLRRETP